MSRIGLPEGAKREYSAEQIARALKQGMMQKLLTGEVRLV